MNSDKPYNYEWLDVNGSRVVMVEFPFLARSGHENDEEFNDRANRDYGMIAQFVRRFAAKKQLDTGTTKVVIEAVKIYTSPIAAYARCFLDSLTAPEPKINEVLDLLYEECIGNLPGNFKYGGLERAAEIEKPKAANKPRGQNSSSSTREDRGCGYTSALFVPVPNPAN